MTPKIVMVPDAFDASNGAQTPFGRRWGGEVWQLSAEHLAALQAGQTLALDVQNEYIVFLKAARGNVSSIPPGQAVAEARQPET